jgi:hypothetical protein
LKTLNKQYIEKFYRKNPYYQVEKTCYSSKSPVALAWTNARSDRVVPAYRQAGLIFCFFCIKAKEKEETFINH